MTAALHDFTAEQGVGWSRTVTWQSGDPATGVDLTGKSPRMQVRRDRATDSPLVLALTIANGGVTLLAQSGATLGKFRVDIDDDALAAIAPGRYWYDIEVEGASGEVEKRLLRGAFKVLAEVTR